MKSRGFTLVELMIVVTIIGVLAALAVVGFSGFITTGRESEAITFLSAIKAKQVSYRAQRGQYAAAATNPTASITDGSKGNWDNTIAAWKVLGVKPGKSAVSFQYVVTRGTGADCTVAPNCAGVTSKTWWWATATNNKRVVYVNSARDPWVKKIPGG